MKRILYIAAVFSGLVLVSCGKQNIEPNFEDNQEVPVWRSLGDAVDEDSDDLGIFGEGDITDPNNDRDENQRKKGSRN